MNGDIDAYHDPMDMLHDATQYLERVRQTLIEADRFEDILQVRSAGELYRQYAGQRRYGIDIQNIGAEIKLRAERRAGELLSAMPKNSGQLFRGDIMIPRDDVPTYTELGLNKQQASRWQRASALPEDLFEQYLSETKERHEPLTSAAVLALANALRRDASTAPPIDVRPLVAGAADLFRLIDTGATFGTIYVDPPYGAMSLHDLAALPVNDLAAEQAHLHLWAPSAYLFDAKAMLEAWGFIYRSTFVWVNPQPGEGTYWRESHTLLLLGVRGATPFREAMRSWVEVSAEPGGGKPDIIREMIERVSPAPYLELFNSQAVPGWSVWHPKTGCTLDHEQVLMLLQPPVGTDHLRVEPEPESADAKRVGRTRKTPPRAAATDTLVPPSSSDFHLLPEMSFAKEVIAGGVAYVFRHCDLGLLGRIVVQDLTGSQCLVSLEVAGDPEDPMTDRRLAVFEPVAKELVRRLEHEPLYRVQGVLIDGFDSTTKSMRTLFPGVRVGYCLRHALNKLPDKLVGLSAPVRKRLRSKFHALWHRCRQRKSLRVVSLGQRLRRFVDHIRATEGEEHGERVRSWMEDKKSGWYAVLEDAQMPAMSTSLDQAHNAMDRKLFNMKGFHHAGGSQAAFLTGLAHLYNLIPYQRRAKSSGLCGVEVEGGRVPTSDWMLNLQILTSGGYRPEGLGTTT